MVARCRSWLFILWCLVSTGLDLFASAVPAAATSSGIRNSILSPVEVGGGSGGYWKERCKRGDWDQDAVPRHLRAFCRNVAEASPSRVDPLERAFLEALIRSAADVGNSDEEGTMRLREDGRPLKLLEKIRRFVDEEDGEDEEETGGRELQPTLSNGGRRGGGERNVYEDGETRSSISAENSAPVVKREPSGDWANRQKLRASLSALARYLNSIRGYARETRNKDAPGNRSTHGPRMSLYFLG